MSAVDCGTRIGRPGYRTLLVAGLMVFTGVFAATGSAIAAETSLSATDPGVTRWEDEVAALEALDQAEPDPDDAILFIGSSSIRLWDSIADDMAPWAVVRRGYGGARFRDLCHHASRLVAAHDPRAIVVFVANDITSPTDSPSVEQVMTDVRATHHAIRQRHPQVPIWYIAVTPTESRWAAWPAIRGLNDAIEAMAAAEPDTFFITTADRFLDPGSGQPIPELFRDDRLHLSPAGYRVWAAEIRRALEAELGPPDVREAVQAEAEGNAAAR